MKPVSYWAALPEWFEEHPLCDPAEKAFKEVQEGIDELREFGADGHADAAQRALDLLQQRLSQAVEVPLTPRQAAKESGYTADHLRDLLRQGKLPNVGEENAPRIRRGDLPRKPPDREQRDSPVEVLHEKLSR